MLEYKIKKSNDNYAQGRTEQAGILGSRGFIGTTVIIRLESSRIILAISRQMVASILCKSVIRTP